MMRLDAVENTSENMVEARLKPLFIAVVTAKLLIAGLLIANLNLLPHAWTDTTVMAAQ
ncbi:hypothetical protein ACQQ2Q_11960 [Agrobacterium sp. ES01]|uniref:hypothetical protein n=1 Tax=Agrobacterium sp. ES01 TaxID=3420714 RepID=UPI003D12326A